QLPGREAPELALLEQDGLTLNVWAPEHGKDLPVAVWIHGGASTAGSGAQPTFDGTRFARDGVVLVTLNYRLGQLGFFAHPELPAGGNFGYMDMIAALRWVRDNIAAFGGDPARVTLMGESAGGMAVTALMASPQARGLFAAAVSQSAGESSMEPIDKAVAAGRELARAAGASDLAALRALPASALVDIPRDRTYAGPMLDGTTLVEQPSAAFAAGRAAPVPFLVGANDREEAAMARLTPEEAKRRLDGMFAAYPAHADAARHLYDVDHVGPVESLVRIISDAGSVEPARYYARQHPTSWVYRFSYVATKDRSTTPAAHHAAELPYVFGTAQWDMSAEDRQATDAVHGAWVRFITTGDPGWPAITTDKELINDFTNAGPVVMTDPLRARLDLVEAAKAR
ncbi:MAG: carboxylesterase family protein, partial [Pseudoxanthomonas sp.]|nr:carboxylesterase family protein [Pseudoxanthomonas sp.]